MKVRKCTLFITFLLLQQFFFSNYFMIQRDSVVAVRQTPSVSSLKTANAQYSLYEHTHYIYISRYKYFKPARNAMLCSFCHHIKFSYFNFLALQKSHYCSFHFKEHTEYSDTRYIISISELKVNVISGAIYGCTEMEWIVVVRVSLHWEKYLPIKLGTHFIEFASAYDFELLTRFQN